MRQGFGSVRKLASGNWQARYMGPDGRVHKAPHTFTARKYAERWLGNEQSLIDKDMWTSPQSRLVKEIVESETVGTYVTRIVQRRAHRARKPLAPTTVNLYMKDFRLRIQEPLGYVRLADLTSSMVGRWWDGLDPSTPTQNGRAYELLNSVMREAVEEKLIAENPCRLKGAGMPLPTHKGVALSVSEVLAYLAGVPEHYRVMLMIAGWCGLRSGEVRGLRRKDVDLKNRVIRVE